MSQENVEIEPYEPAAPIVGFRWLIFIAGVALSFTGDLGTWWSIVILVLVTFFALLGYLATEDPVLVMVGFPITQLPIIAGVVIGDGIEPGWGAVVGGIVASIIGSAIYAVVGVRITRNINAKQEARALRDVTEPRDPTVTVEHDEGRVPSAAIDVEGWLSDAASICTNAFEPSTELLLELATLERLGIRSVMDGLLGESPRGELGDDTATALSNARMGYALRNRETQLLDQTDYIARGDALAALLDQRAVSDAALNLAAVHAVLRDVLSAGDPGRLYGLYQATPGTTPAARREAIQGWANQHFPGDDPRTGLDVTIDLLEYGYFLHRLFEIRPDWLEDLS